MASTVIKRFASAVWKGGIPKGNGTMSSQSGVFKDLPYSIPSRFENVSKEMEPTLKNSLLLHMLVQRLEDLVTHLGCFSMALSAVLSTEHKLTPDIIKTNATISVAKDTKGWTVSGIHLDVVAKIPGADQATFEKAAKTAKETCPVSKLFNTNITLSTKLEK